MTDDLSRFIETTRGALGMDGLRVVDLGGGRAVFPVVESVSDWARRLGVEPEPPAPQPEEPKAPERRITDAERLAQATGLRIERPS